VLDVLRQIQDKTGLKIELAPGAAAYLPYAEETRLRITARNVSLRDALTAMLSEMAFEWRAEKGTLIVGPSAPLVRVGRRPTLTGVGVLAMLMAAKLQAGQPVLDQLRAATGTPELRFFWHMRDDAVRQQALAEADKRLPMTGRQYLEALCHPNNWTWYLWGTQIVIIPQDLQAGRQLKQRVSVEYRNKDLLSVLEDLAELFAKYQYRMLPVVDKHDHLLGVIYYNDIMKGLLTHAKI
jgi:hypothetical protein